MKHPTFDLKQLQTLIAVADSGGFTAAAEKLHYAQSAVSMQIRRLEEQVGALLIHRSRQGFTLTQEGEKLLGYARKLIRINDAAWTDLTVQPVRGVVRLGIPADYGFYLSDTLQYFVDQYPYVEMEVRCELSVSLVRKVQAGDLDFALVTRQPRSPGGEMLRREPLLWAGDPRYELHKQSPLPLALYPQGICIFRDSALTALSEADLGWRIVYTSQSLAGIRTAVKAGLGITVAIPSMLDQDLRDLGDDSELPSLPEVEIALHRAPGRPKEPARVLARLLSERLVQSM
ncbi:MAG: LysR substrate-binding domain-containing protein [Thermodesulfobacteriota bacterium]